MKKYFIFIGATSILILTGCSNSYPTVNKYTNSKIKNEKSKQQIFKNDSLKCQVYADNIVSMPQRSYYTPAYSGSGDFKMTNTATGQEYRGTYNSGGSFSSGLASGSAVGGQMADKMEENKKKTRAWQYCMLSSGWHEK